MPTPQPKPEDESIIGPRDALGFVLRLGRALHVYGIPAHRLEEVMEKAAEKLGLQGQFFSTPTSIFASFGPQDRQRTFLMRVTPGEVNLGKLAELNNRRKTPRRKSNGAKNQSSMAAGRASRRDDQRDGLSVG